MSELRLARSSLWVTLAQAAQVVTRLVVTPVVIATLGITGYGTWALLFALCTTALLVQGSFFWAITKRIAELDPDGSRPQAQSLLGSSMALSAMAGGTYLLVVSVAAGWLLPRLGASQELLPAALPAVYLLSTMLFLQIAGGAAIPALAGLQRVDLQYKIELVGSVIELIAVPLLLAQGLGLAALALAHGIRNLTGITLAWILCRRLRPDLFAGWPRVTRAGLRSTGGLALRFQAPLTLAVAVHHVVRLVISALCGVEMLGMFHLASRILEVAKTPAAAVIQPLMPAFASLGAGGDRRREQRLFAASLRTVALAAALPLGFVACLAEPLLLAWTGEVYSWTAWTVRVLAPADLVTSTVGVTLAGLRAAGRIRPEMLLRAISAFLVIAGVSAGYAGAGYPGVVLAMSAAQLVAGLWFQRWRIRRQGLRFAAYLSGLVRPVALLAIPAVTSLVVTAMLNGGESRTAAALRLAAGAASYALLALPLLWRWQLDGRQRAALRELLPGGRSP